MPSALSPKPEAPNPTALNPKALNPKPCAFGSWDSGFPRAGESGPGSGMYGFRILGFRVCYSGLLGCA